MGICALQLSWPFRVGSGRVTWLSDFQPGDWRECHWSSRWSWGGRQHRFPHRRPNTNGRSFFFTSPQVSWLPAGLLHQQFSWLGSKDPQRVCWAGQTGIGSWYAVVLLSSTPLLMNCPCLHQRPLIISQTFPAATLLLPWGLLNNLIAWEGTLWCHSAWQWHIFYNTIPWIIMADLEIQHSKFLIGLDC